MLRQLRKGKTMDLKAFPIYMRRGSLINNQDRLNLQKATGRPIVYTHWDPKDCVLDTLESLRLTIATSILNGMIASPRVYKLDGKALESTEEYMDLAYCYADSMIAKSIKPKKEK